MNCRNCGASMQPVGGRAYFRCPHCTTFEFPQTNDDGIAPVGAATGFHCPVCTGGLATAAIEGHQVCFCGKCRGFLATNQEFGMIVPLRRSQLGDQPSVPRSFGKDELIRQVGCPKCRKRMDTHPYGGGGNVVVDTCHRCHLIWLDAGELEIIARHRPERTSGREELTGLTPKFDGPPREPESRLRWAWEADPHNRHHEGDGANFWDLLKRWL